MRPDAYMARARDRLVELNRAYDRGAYRDVVTGSRDAVAFAFEALVRAAGVAAWRGPRPITELDFSGLLDDTRERFPASLRVDLPRLARASREFSCYVDGNLLPAERYRREGAHAARVDAGWVVARVERALEREFSVATRESGGALTRAAALERGGRRERDLGR